ncbi:hypothetical protein CHS0354_002568 [Potamilus streckersoni]|uniref:Uncharacterized protein n=1 Tax=Potamilus streckersoni TaxID=2493646 RepID=A0AAE0TFF8_9BIVA|nr:hypothetical protein CHS0354_002568 [Potamilus streckersoni]
MERKGNESKQMYNEGFYATTSKFKHFIFASLQNGFNSFIRSDPLDENSKFIGENAKEAILISDIEISLPLYIIKKECYL